MREELLSAVRARNAAALGGGDPQAVLVEDAVREADALLARVTGAAGVPGVPDVEALHAVGWLYWLRAQSLPVEDMDQDLELALMVLQPVHDSDPSAVPELLRSFYTEHGPDDAPPFGTRSSTDPAALTNQGVEMHEWYRRTGDLDALRTAVRVFRAALEVVPEAHPNFRMCRTNLYTAVSELAERTEDVAAWREAVRVILDVARVDDDPEILDEAGTALHGLFECTGELDALRRSVEFGRRAADAEPDEGGYLSNLAVRLTSLHECTGDEQALLDAVEALRGAADLLVGHPEHPAVLSNLSNVLRLRFALDRDPAVLREAADVGRMAVEFARDEEQGATATANLNAVLQALYEETGDVAVLREAVEAGRDAVDALAADHPDRPRTLANLGISLRELFERTGDLGVLREAEAAHRTCVAVTPVGHPKRASRLTNLGNTLRAVFFRTEDSDVLREAVAVSRQAVAELPEGHPLRVGALSNLGNNLLYLAERTWERDALPEAVEAHRAAVAEMPVGHPARDRYLSNLGLALGLWFEESGDRAVLREAVELCREAVAARGDDGRALSSLASALRKSFEQGGDHTALGEARAALTRAFDSPAAAVDDRISIGRQLAEVASLAGDHASALATMREVVDLLPQVASRDLRRADRAHQLGEVSGVGGHAAAVALAAGQPDLAVELVERARGVLLAETMDARTDLARLERHAPDLAERFTRVRDHLAVVETSDDDPDAARATARRRRVAAAEWEALLEDVRARPGLADFLAPQPVSRLREQAVGGPVVVVSASDDRCDALVVTADPGEPVRHVPLPGVTQADVNWKAAQFLQFLRFAADADDLDEHEESQAALREVLGWLWDNVTGPVLDALGHGPREEGWPRLWWCPVGGLARLPLHAAGHHDDPGRTVLDRVVSSCTTTIRALAYARERPASTADRRALIVALPDTPGASPLTGVARELGRIGPLLPGATVLQGAEATHRAVLEALPHHAVAHFACHGVTDWKTPEANRLLLHDHETDPLTVATLTRLHLADADLAYLSACNTSDTHPALTDEAAHITSAFQLAGYRNVVGTLWPINDQAATRIAADVYDHLTAGGTRAPRTEETALALHHAVRRLRAARRSTPTLWAAHIHMGL